MSRVTCIAQEALERRQLGSRPGPGERLAQELNPMFASITSRVMVRVRQTFLFSLASI